VKNRPGFSLVLTLIILAMLTLTVLLSASFIAIESRLAMQNHLATRARMNGVCSLRLALAHLQQEAGPDRRMTARADITADKLQFGWTWSTIRNPLWTGVWRSDRPLQPPAWLVSGRHDRTPGAQSASLFGINLSNVSNYDGLALAPWDNSYTPGPTDLVTLVGDASASGPVNRSTSVPGKPDGRIKLPRVPLPDTGANGTYAYWIGDEGVKARLDLNDPRVNAPTATDQTKQEALRGVARSGAEILVGLEALPASGLDRRVRSFQDLSLLTSGDGLNETSPPSVVRRLQTETTFWSRGVNCDSQFGGLKIDLSNAFELTDAEWDRTEFAAGAPPLDSAGQPLSGVTYLLNGQNTTVTNTIAYGDNKVNVPYDGANHSLSTVYTFTPVFGNTAQNAQKARGPTWDALRNYHRLYKELDWTNPAAPSLRARAHFPNTRSLAASGYPGTAHYTHQYGRMDTAENFLALDRFTAQGQLKEAPRPVKVAVTPYVSRQLLVWGVIQDAGQLRLTLSPITVLHNPYNVALRLEKDPTKSDIAAMRLSFRFWDNWTVKFFTTSKDSWTRRIGDLARAVDPTSNNLDSLRTYIATGTVLQPGEFRVFSSASSRPDPFTRVPPLASNSYNFLGGFWLPWLDPAGAPVTRQPGEEVRVQIMNSGEFFVRHLLSSWPGDSIMETGNSSDPQIFNVCSQIHELTAMSLARSGQPAEKFFPSGSTLPSPGSPPQIIGVFDYGARWARDPQPFPLFSHSNPMATSVRADAAGLGLGHAAFNTFAPTSPSFKMVLREANNWSEVMEATGAGARLAFGGNSASSGAGGQSSAVYTEVPFAPPLSLAQFAHANFTIRDHEPLLAIGNSFGSLFNAFNEMSRIELPPKAIVTNVTTWDHSWMLNAALFDRFYFSGAAPEITRGPKVSEKRTLSKVLDDFVAGTSTLANPRTTLCSDRDPVTTRAMVGNHRRIAGATLTEGAFNVNSTSVEAWTAVLAGAKRNAMGKATEDQPGKTQNARFPRATRADKAGFNYRSLFTSADAWTGLATLDDDQIKRLARSIVDEIRQRSMIVHRSPVTRDHPNLVRTPKDYSCENDTLDIPVPFTGMAQFVNRNLCGYPTGKPVYSMTGCIQSAITRTDVDGFELSNRSVSNPAPPANQTSLNPSAAGTAGVPWVSQPGSLSVRDSRTIDTERGHMLMGAPTSLTQADVLAAIGPGLSTRSDTFVIRCYGSAVSLGSSDPAAGCWLEAVVQRRPEFCDPSQPPETEVCDPTDSYKTNPRLLKVNGVLGRRFRIVSLRVLSSRDL